LLLNDGADLDGYDIVYVDFDNGVDYIQRNARLLEKVIKWVNQNKTGTQPNVILSMSMGGLVAQYALCEIESQNPTNPTAYPPHQVRLLITHDSPHQGANVPLSLQMTVRHLAGLSISNPIPFTSSIKLVDRLPILGQARDALLSPAAQQMLRYQTARQTGLLGFGGKVIAASTSLYDTFQQEYQALLFADGRTGVPKGTTSLPCRVVASSNGSECGRGQPYEPYAVLLQIQQTENIATIPLLAGGTAAAGAGYLLASGSISGPAGIIAAGVFSAFALGLTGAYDVSAVAQLNALPDQQQREICYIWAKLKKRSRLFGLLDVSVPIIEYCGNSLATQLPLDSGSGGIISLADYAQQLNGSALSIPPGVIRQQQFCFVPTYSALNIAPASSAALRASYTPGTNVGTPFANFRTAVRENESHISYTTINSTWMLQEIRQQTPSIPNCAAFCQANPVTIGGAQVCSGSSGTYSVTPPANTMVIWQVQPFGIATLSASSGSSTTVSPASSTANGQVTLTATIQSECGEFSVSKVIPVGRRPLQLSPAPYTITFCRNQEVYIQLNGLPFITGDFGTSGNSVVWSSDPPGGNGSVLVYGQGSGAATYRTPPTGAPFVFTITINDACGSYTSNPAFYYGAPANCAERTAQPLAAATLYPNPAREAVEVHVENADISQPLTVRVFDALGQPRAEQTKAGVETLTLNTEKLPAGLYFLHVLRGKEVLSRQQLRIEK
jgi:hypothetical protein